MEKNNSISKKEEGFSLLELVVACAIVIIIASASYFVIPGIIGDSQDKTDAYEQCNLQRETEITSLLDGQETQISATCSPTPTPAP